MLLVHGTLLPKSFPAQMPRQEFALHQDCLGGPTLRHGRLQQRMHHIRWSQHPEERLFVEHISYIMLDPLRYFLDQWGPRLRAVMQLARYTRLS